MRLINYQLSETLLTRPYFWTDENWSFYFSQG